MAKTKKPSKSHRPNRADHGQDGKCRAPTTTNSSDDFTRSAS
jgi:hypothetical protein